MHHSGVDDDRRIWEQLQVVSLAHVPHCWQCYAGDSPPCPQTEQRAMTMSTGQTVTDFNQSQWGRFRLGIRQSLLTGKIIKERDRLPGEGQEPLFLKVLQVEGDICHADPTVARGWISSRSKTQLWFPTTSQMRCWSPPSDCSDLGADNGTAKAEIQCNQHAVNRRQGLGKTPHPALAFHRIMEWFGFEGMLRII